MGEPLHYNLANAFAEVIYIAIEAEYMQGQRDLNATMCRLKDLSAYSLVHAEILEQREGVEMLAIALLFGMSSNQAFRPNQVRLQLLSPETLAYQGQKENIEREIAERENAPQPFQAKPDPEFKQQQLL
jgi:hypothetical protein